MERPKTNAPVSARARVWSVTLGGPQLATLLDQVEVASLSDAECVVFAQAVVRQQSWTDARLFGVTARFATHRPGPEPATDCESFGLTGSGRSVDTRARDERSPVPRPSPQAR